MRRIVDKMKYFDGAELCSYPTQTFRAYIRLVRVRSASYGLLIFAVLYVNVVRARTYPHDVYNS